MARSKTTTHHPEIRRSHRGAASATTTGVPPASTPPPAPVVSPPPPAAPVLPPSLAPSSSSPQPTAAASAVPSTAAIPTPVTSQGELDEDTGSDNGAGSQFGSESEDSSRGSPQTEHLEEEQQKSGSDFADENVEEEEESSNEEDDHLSAKESVPVRLSRAQKGKQKIDERSNVADIPTEHRNVGHPSSDVPTSATHPQLFEHSLLRKGLVHYQYNADPKEPAIAVSAFGSANAGTASLPTTLFATGVDDTVLAKSFKTDVTTIQKLKAGLAPKA
ncbi:Germin-like protein [Forsythia ovata]|uniref:Germin-like protein n=1 Tax=Forsythia ovata TaxID=205694 RepID=A0ABD1VFV5_9LAMI